jgi:hypothetical protein
MDYVDDLVTLLPELILAALVLVIITVDLFLPRANKWRRSMPASTSWTTYRCS